MAGFMDIIHCQEFYITRKHCVLELELFLSSGEGKETATLFSPSERPNRFLRLAVSKGPSRVGFSLPSHEDGNIQIPKYHVFYFFRILDDGQRP
jgi:hypothetical protein